MGKLFTLLKEKQKQWKNLLTILNSPTHICKNCFKKFEFKSLHGLLNEETFCNKCLNEMNPIFYEFRIEGIKAMALYNYDEIFKGHIFTYKGCYDYELKDIFVKPYSLELRLIYPGYNLVPLPSFIEDDLLRGFNHVEEMFKCLNLPIIKVLRKRFKHKQSDLHFEERKKVIDVLEVIDGKRIEGKKVLIVDDICTTGSSLRAAIKLLKPYGPRKIKILTVSKRNFTKEEKNELKDVIDILE